MPVPRCAHLTRHSSHSSVLRVLAKSLCSVAGQFLYAVLHARFAPREELDVVCDISKRAGHLESLSDTSTPIWTSSMLLVMSNRCITIRTQCHDRSDQIIRRQSGV